MAISIVKLVAACALIISGTSAQYFFDNNFGADFSDSFDSYYGNDDFGYIGSDDFYGGVQTFGLPSFGQSFGGLYPSVYSGSFGGFPSYNPVLVRGGMSSVPLFLGGYRGGFGGLSASYGLYSDDGDYSSPFVQPYLGGGAFSLGSGSFIL